MLQNTVFKTLAQDPVKTGSLNRLQAWLYCWQLNYPISTTALLPNSLPNPESELQQVFHERVVQSSGLSQLPKAMSYMGVYIPSQDCLAALTTFSSPAISWFILKKVRTPDPPHQQRFCQGLTGRKPSLREHFSSSPLSKEYFLKQERSWDHTQQVLQFNNTNNGPSVSQGEITLISWDKH